MAAIPRIHEVSAAASNIHRSMNWGQGPEVTPFAPSALPQYIPYFHIGWACFPNPPPWTTARRGRHSAVLIDRRLSRVDARMAVAEATGQIVLHTGHDATLPDQSPEAQTQQRLTFASVLLVPYDMAELSLARTLVVDDGHVEDLQISARRVARDLVVTIELATNVLAANAHINALARVRAQARAQAS